MVPGFACPLMFRDSLPSGILQHILLLLIVPVSAVRLQTSFIYCRIILKDR